MPDKALTSLSPRRRSRAKTKGQRIARSNRALVEERNRNLAKARRVRKKNLRARKLAAKR